MPNYRDYQKSVAAEFNAYKDRVRNIIDDKHWGMDGHHKEVVLMNYLKRVLPKHLSVGTGFIKTKDGITTQIDIIVYDNRYPTLFEEGDFVIAIPESVVGIVEVKSNIRASSLCEIIKKANENGSIICGKTSKTIFNGVFAYASVGSNDAVLNSLDKITYDENWKKSIIQLNNFLINLLNLFFFLNNCVYRKEKRQVFQRCLKKCA